MVVQPDLHSVIIKMVCFHGFLHFPKLNASLIAYNFEEETNEYLHLTHTNLHAHEYLRKVIYIAFLHIDVFSTTSMI